MSVSYRSESGSLLTSLQAFSKTRANLQNGCRIEASPKRLHKRGMEVGGRPSKVGCRVRTVGQPVECSNFFCSIYQAVSEDIVLGPPKTAFASAGARNVSRPFDSPNRANAAANDEESAKGERQSFRDKDSKDEPRNERDGDRIRDARPENLRLRRDDNERWGGAKTPKTPFDDIERRYRRNGDRDQGRDRDLGRDAGRGGRGFDSFQRNGGQEGNGEDLNQRRNGHGRGRNEPSWYRDDDRPEAESLENAKDTSRRDWRDRDKGGGRGLDRDLKKGGKSEHEPEWMDEPSAEEKKQAHTQEDFQRWKEKMKAGNAPVQEPPPSPEPRPNHERTLSGKIAATGKARAETPLILDSASDGFFGLWGDAKKEGAHAGVEEQAKKLLGKPSKFTGFFAPKSNSKAAQEPAPASAPLPNTARDSSTEDKEGFQRILKLLDQQQSSSSRDITPFRDLPRSVPQSPPQPPLPNPTNPLESFPTQPQQDRPVPQSRDSEFLLKLMQQAQPHHSNQAHLEEPPSQLPRGPPPPSLFPFSNLMVPSHYGSQQPSSTGPPPGFFSDLPRDDFLQRDKPTPRKPQPSLPGCFDDFPSLHRPPGLDMFPPPQQQQQRQPPVQPPPGFPIHMRNPNAFPPGLMPERGAPFGGRGQGMPPPGFFGMNAPPGFPPMGFATGNGQQSESGRGPVDFADFGGQGQGSMGGKERIRGE